jgi:predicted metallo-beta-lactamase superfamily hydrolase
MCTLVETKDAKIVIDPGVALGPSRYGLPPHQLEWDRLEAHWRRIVELAGKAQVLVVTHYHYDHHNPNDHLEIYKGKVVLVKHPTEKINYSQKTRAAYFLKQLEGFPTQLEYCDGGDFTFGRTRVKFSPPVFHGTNPKLGYVTEVLVEERGRKFIFTSDVEGPSQKDQADFILQNRPNLVMLDGPLSYMVGYRYSFENLKASVENMVKIVEVCPLEALVVDHHLLRDLKWRERIETVFKAGEKKKVKVMAAAEYLGAPLDMLEARRAELYKKIPQPRGAEARRAIEE